MLILVYIYPLSKLKDKHTHTHTHTHCPAYRGEGNERINLGIWKNDIIIDTRRKLLLIRYRFGELIID